MTDDYRDDDDWARRMDFLLSECKAGRFSQFVTDPDPDVADLCAMIRASQADDFEGIACILKNCSLVGVVMAAVKCLSEVCTDLPGVSPGFLTVWCEAAAKRES